MVADVLQVAQGLEHMLVALRQAVGHVYAREVLVQAALQGGQLAVVVLSYLGRQLREHVFFHAAEEEWKNLEWKQSK